jgi:AcrR family transcriptional regulator
MTGEISLREKKFAKTKIAIMEECIKQLETTRFEDISIQKLCEAVEISEGTFYNYYPKKVDVVFYFKALLNLKTHWKIHQAIGKARELKAIDILFKSVARDIPNANVIYELMAVMIRDDHKDYLPDLTAAEKSIAFPECEGIEEITGVPFQDYFGQCIEGAIQKGELPAETNMYESVLFLMSILCGLMIAVPEEELHTLGAYYEKQLVFLWKGLGRKYQ